MKKNNIEVFVANMFLMICIICIIIGIVKCCSSVSTPVEEMVDKTTDSLILDNTNIKVDIIKLDSIKNEEIKKTATLNNDSTLKLFYKLLGK